MQSLIYARVYAPTRSVLTHSISWNSHKHRWINNWTDPFGPSTTQPSSSSPKESTRDVTIPFLPELHYPDTVFHALPPPGPLFTSKQPNGDVLSSSPFMSALNDVGNRQYTLNLAHAYSSTLSPSLDAFNGLSQVTDAADFEPLLGRSWESDPLTTVKIVFNLRSIHEGKSEREGFYRAWGWLYRNHPKTAIANLKVLIEPLVAAPNKSKPSEGVDNKRPETSPEETKRDTSETETQLQGKTHGYWKDLLNILVLAAEGKFDNGAACFTTLHRDRIPPTVPRSRRRRIIKGKRGHKYHPRGSSSTLKQHAFPREARIALSKIMDAKISSNARVKRDLRHRQWRNKLEELLSSSVAFKALYVTVANLFAQGLEADRGILQRIAATTDQAERKRLSLQLSLCAKYAPSIGGMHDRITNIPSAIAQILWTKGLLGIHYNPSLAIDTLKNDHVHDLRSAYTRWIVSPLRRYLQIPEVYMSNNRWNELPYQSVPSICMQRNKQHFLKYDEKRFVKYLNSISEGKRKISGATLLPHTLLAEAFRIKANCKDESTSSQVEILVVENQWRILVENLKKSGVLDNCMAICDVSGSMGDIDALYFNASGPQPIFPAVALSIVLAQTARSPWNNSFITFSAVPEIVKLDCPEDGLVEMARKMVTSKWDMNTDFNAVFTKLILPMAVEHKLSREDMVKRLFVFSDMEFDTSRRASPSRVWDTEHEKIERAFNTAGYDIPEIVYWNLQGAKGPKQVLNDRKGVAMVSGFSPNMLKTFMQSGSVDMGGDGGVEGEETGGTKVRKVKRKMTPEEHMNNILNTPGYSALVVLD